MLNYGFLLKGLVAAFSLPSLYSTSLSHCLWPKLSKWVRCSSVSRVSRHYQGTPVCITIIMVCACVCKTTRQLLSDSQSLPRHRQPLLQKYLRYLKKGYFAFFKLKWKRKKKTVKTWHFSDYHFDNKVLQQCYIYQPLSLKRYFGIFTL